MYLCINFSVNKIIMTGEPMHTASKERKGAMRSSYQLLSEKRSIHYASLSANYTALQIKNCSKSTSAFKVATMKNMDDFCYGGKPSCATTKLTLFAVSKDEWDAKEDTGKSMKNAFYVLQYAKRHLSGQRDIEQ